MRTVLTWALLFSLLQAHSADYTPYLFAPADAGLELRELALVHLLTGKIVVGDPLHSRSQVRLRNTFPTGRFPVFVALHTDDQGMQSVALAAIRFSDARPVRWEPVDAPNTRHSMNFLFGSYATQSGLGSYLDESSARRLQHKLQSDQSFSDSLFDELDTKGSGADWTWAAPQLSEGLGAVVFSAGTGDRFCTSSLGYDANGALAWLVTDFVVIEELAAHQDRHFGEATNQPMHVSPQGDGEQLVRVGIAVLVLGGLGYLVFRMLGHRSSYLCDRCKFNSSRYCSRPERPNASRCPEFKSRF